MTPQEKDLIQSVFERLAAQTGVKDAEADGLIADNLRRRPDAAYGLVQAVVMLEAGLKQAQARISELQRQQSATPAAGGSFLGGGSPWAASVPPSAAPAAPQYYQPSYQPTPMVAAQPVSPWAQPSGGSSFLRNAATMAAGVAGGTLIAEGLTSLLGGHAYGGGFGGGYGGGLGGGFGGGIGGYDGGPREVVENVTVNNYYDNQSAGQGAADSGLQDASYDSSGDFGGGSDDGFDI